ncbi:MAG: sigma-54-dependent transcriptional regulator [Methylophilaceae bacterium]
MDTDKPRLILVDDDPLITDTMHFILEKDFEVSVAESRLQVKSLLRQLDSPPQIALVDLGLPPSPHKPDEGFMLIGELLAHSPSMKIFVLSGQNNDANARHALSLGAAEFVGKPCDVNRLRGLLLDALRIQTAETTAEKATHALIGGSLAIQALRTQISQLADTIFPVLIEGESGTGKELVASCLHQQSKRNHLPYLSLNCAAISPTLAESVLFGHIKGAFTGASNDAGGYFEDTGDGTLFLDEIGELPLEMQAKLLRVLENGEFQRIGETKVRKSRARIVAATNRDLREEVREGRFRADLYHRLSVFSLRSPPLRELDDDRVLLLEHFGQFYAKEIGCAPFKLDKAAHESWMEYGFPGNVRELRNVVIRLTAKHPNKTVSREQLIAELDPVADRMLQSKTMLSDPQAMLDFAHQHLQSHSNVNLDQILRQWEKAYAEAALDLAHGNLSQAARILNINRTTLYGRMQLLTTDDE